MPLTSLSRMPNGRGGKKRCKAHAGGILLGEDASTVVADRQQALFGGPRDGEAALHSPQMGIRQAADNRYFGQRLFGQRFDKQNRAS